MKQIHVSWLRPQLPLLAVEIAVYLVAGCSSTTSDPPRKPTEAGAADAGMQLALRRRADRSPDSFCSLEIVRTLGVGGMATVYLARRTEGGRSCDVAVKKPHAFLAEDPTTLAVLEDEARIGASIHHPNVVGVIGLAGGDEPALVMEWIDGLDLAKLLRLAAQAERRLPLDVVAAIARDVLAGLHAAHESRHADGRALGVVHRDVSPENILVGFDGSARITDFGVAKAAFRGHHTVDDAVKGKLRYLAPEQLAGRSDRRADVYSVGAVLWELRTGAPMRKGSGVEVLVEIVSGQVPAPSESAPEAASLDDVVMRALERCPEERFATAATMGEAIERAVGVASPARVAEIVRELGSEGRSEDADRGQRGARDLEGTSMSMARAPSLARRTSSAPSRSIPRRARSGMRRSGPSLVARVSGSGTFGVPAAGAAQAAGPRVSRGGSHGLAPAPTSGCRAPSGLSCPPGAVASRRSRASPAESTGRRRKSQRTGIQSGLPAAA